MPYSKRTNRRRKRRNYKKRRVARMYKTPRQDIIHTKRTHVINWDWSVTGFPSGINYAGIAPALNELPSFAEFTELFSMYRFNKIVVKFLPAIDSMDLASTTFNTRPQIIMYITTADRSGIPTRYDTEDEFLEDSRMRSKNYTQTWSAKYTPSILVPVYESAVTTGYKPVYKQWISTDSYDVPHYGFSWFALALTGSVPGDGTHMGRFVVTSYLSFKNVR